MAKNPWDQHIGKANNGFATAQDYASAIQQKEASGQTLSDPGAAAAFKAANPGLFSVPSGGYASTATQATAPITNTPADQIAGNIQFFGSPEAYAQKIIEKEARGEGLTDPASAALFKQQNPYLFPGEQKKNILQQLQQAQQQPVNIEQLPDFGIMQNVAKQRGDIASRQAMETLNQRGILNSTITADNVAQIQQQAQTEILPVLLERAYGLRQEQVQNLMGMLDYWSKEDKAQEERQQTAAKAKADAENARLKLEIEQKEKDVKRALDEVQQYGYTTNFASKVLNIPVGTKTTAAIKAANDIQISLDRLKISQGQLAVSQGQLGVAQGNLAIRGQELTQKSKEITPKASADNYAASFDEIESLYNKLRKEKPNEQPNKSEALGWLKSNADNFTDTDYKAVAKYINEDSPFE